ncbi:hypothetical protein Ahy_A01g002309 [Arachis hypogaea]|uniref:PB1-like domain-containing protein n=1 Tax=Arachis hypogaea TaxID=3818 RepID=A0A445EQG5_ARAHY|nr:hypothetical protein Ahy_A01g002309 [Arachis hypogaea]
MTLPVRIRRALVEQEEPYTSPFVFDNEEVTPFEEQRMATIHITLSIHHRGRFERGPCRKVSYIGGEVTEIERDIGYTLITEFYWLEPGKELNDGLRLLSVDMDVVRMYEAAMKNGNKINMYTEYPVDHSVVVEEKELTPSKMRRKVCAKRIPTPKKTPRRRLAVEEDDDDAEIAGNVQVVKQAQISAEAQPILTVPKQIPNPAPSATHEAINIFQPLPTPVQPDKPPSTQSQPFQPPLEVDQQPSQTHGTDPVLPPEANVSEASQLIKHDQQPSHTDEIDQVTPSEANVSEPITPEQLTQYIPHPYKNLLSQSIPELVPPSDSNRTPQNNETNPSDEAKGRPKRNKRRSTRRPPSIGQSFIPNPDLDKPPTFFVLVDEEDFSDDNAGYHCYESEDLHSIPSDEDSDETPVFPQSNADAPVSQVRLELGMEFETLNQFRKAVMKQEGHGSKNDASWARSWRCQLGYKGRYSCQRQENEVGVANLDIATPTHKELSPGGNQGAKLALPTLEPSCQRHNTSKFGSPGSKVGVANSRTKLPTPTQARNLSHEGVSRALPTPRTMGVVEGNATHTSLALEQAQPHCQLEEGVANATQPSNFGTMGSKLNHVANARWALPTPHTSKFWYQVLAHQPGCQTPNGAPTRLPNAQWRTNRVANAHQPTIRVANANPGIIQVANARERHHARCQRPMALPCTLPTPGSKHGALRRARARCQRAKEKELFTTTPGNCGARC